MLKSLSLLLVYTLFNTSASTAQTDTLAINPGKMYFDPGFHYSYDPLTPTFNYSGNWDVDGDGKTDSIYFIGNGGAHTYYHLRFILSTEHKTRDLPFLSIDLPYPGNAEHLKRPGQTTPPVVPQFVVHDFNGDSINDIYINFDIRDYHIPKKWKLQGLSSRYAVISYKNKKLVMKNFKQ